MIVEKRRNTSILLALTMNTFWLRLSDTFKIVLQYCIPQRVLTQCVYSLTRSKNQRLKTFLIKQFIRYFKIDLSLAETTDISGYESFNAFFTRRLRADRRPIISDRKTILCPVDGRVSQCGTLVGDRLLQAKGKTFTLSALLADTTLADSFCDGVYVTLYLSPRDYHRIHMPVTGSLERTLYVPGRLFAVNPPTTRSINGVFAKNERLIALFTTTLGKMAVVMVGALFVSALETVWEGEIAAGKNLIDKNHRDISIQQGAEMGRFNMGSTVIVLFPRHTVQLAPDIVPDQSVIMGKRMGSC